MKLKSLFFLILIILGFSKVPAATDCTQVTEIPQLECEALMALYNSTNGSEWDENTDWNVTNTPCSWYGISCVGGHVIIIDLSVNGLSGSIPAELGNLSLLEELYLYENQLGGSIPVELGNLSNLWYLGLYSNQLNGSIPSVLGNLSNLEYLYLDGNQLSDSIPAELGNLSNLEYLYLYENQLSGLIPAELGNLSLLEELFLDNNQLCGDIPLSLVNLSNLYFLYLQGNGLNIIDLDPELEAFFNDLPNAIWEPQYPSICPASLATLAFFRAVANPKGVLLKWQTLSEYENAGFYIWRGELIGSQCTSRRSDYYEVVEIGFKVTEGDGFSSGAGWPVASGAPYSYWDDTVKPTTTYCYLLGDVDFSRNITPHWDLITLVTTR